MRIGEIKRKTKETEIIIKVNLDGVGKFSSKVNEDGGGVKFLFHMLENFSKHSLIDLNIDIKGDLPHHIIEDLGIVLAEALNKALGDKKGIKRFGWALIPMDEALAQVVIDLGGRPYTKLDLGLKLDVIEFLPVSLLNHFLETFTTNFKINLHAAVLYGEDDHHKVEVFFKALAIAMKDAISFDERKKDQIPSTKGTI
ncbi:MAG: imidazoleglycerol-phosphate dehydratase [Candidatus Lokiarchaeota archaeon]|nr:imidazoleglycerol-phosphate dehydratase [Candidatus Lokiarchaeota archaeon]